MGAAKLLTAAGGGITLDAASTATDKTITVPADNGTLIYANSSGNVGIGTSSPVAKLSLNGPAQFASSSGTFPSSGTGIEVVGNTSGALNYIQAYNRTASSWQDLSIGANTLQFGTGGSERARIDSSGLVRIGSTSGGNGIRLNVTGDTSPDALCSFKDTRTDGYSGAPVMYFQRTGGEVGSIRTTTSSTSYLTSSDYRLKENVQPMQGALDTVAQLKPVTYTWKVDGAAGQGFIAHELQAVVPDCVQGEKDEVDADGNPKYQGIDTSFLVATLTAAIQELSAKNDALEARLTALENK